MYRLKQMHSCGATAGLLFPMAAVGVLSWVLLQHTSPASTAIWQAVADPGAGVAACGHRRGYTSSGRRLAMPSLMSRWASSRQGNETKGAFVVLVGPGKKNQQVRQHVFG